MTVDHDLRHVVVLGPYPPPWGGVSTYVSSLNRLLGARGAELWCYGGPPPAGGARAVDSRRLSLAAALVRAGRRRTLLDNSHFLVEYPHAVLLPLLAVLKPLLRLRWVKVVHDGTLPDRAIRFRWWERVLLRLAARSVDSWVTVDHRVADWLRSELGVGSTVITPLLPLTEDDVATASDPTTAAFLESHREVVVAVGALTPDYGLPDVVDAVRKLRAGGRDVGLLVAASTFAVDPTTRGAVLAAGPWVLVQPDLPRPQLLNAVRLADVLVRSARRDSFGLAKVEAVLLGTQVVAVATGAVEGMATYRFGDVDALRAALEAALDGAGPSLEAARERYGHEARAGAADVVGLLLREAACA